MAITERIKLLFKILKCSILQEIQCVSVILFRMTLLQYNSLVVLFLVQAGPGGCKEVQFDRSIQVCGIGQLGCQELSDPGPGGSG